MNSNEDIGQKEGFCAQGDRDSDARVVIVKCENTDRCEEEPRGVNVSTSAELGRHKERIPEGTAKQAPLSLIVVVDGAEELMNREVKFFFRKLVSSSWGLFCIITLEIMIQ